MFHKQNHLVTCLSSVQLLNCVQLFVTLWTAACQASLSITNSWSLLKLMSIELVMPSNHLILSHPLLLLPSIFPSIRVFFSESFFASGGQSIGVSASTWVLPHFFSKKVSTAITPRPWSSPDNYLTSGECVTTLYDYLINPQSNSDKSALWFSSCKWMSSFWEVRWNVKCSTQSNPDSSSFLLHSKTTAL